MGTKARRGREGGMKRRGHRGVNVVRHDRKSTITRERDDPFILNLFQMTPVPSFTEVTSFERHCAILTIFRAYYCFFFQF